MEPEENLVNTNIQKNTSAVPSIQETGIHQDKSNRKQKVKTLKRHISFDRRDVDKELIREALRITNYLKIPKLKKSSNGQNGENSKTMTITKEKCKDTDLHSQSIIDDHEPLTTDKQRSKKSHKKNIFSFPARWRSSPYNKYKLKTSDPVKRNFFIQAATDGVNVFMLVPSNEEQAVPFKICSNPVETDKLQRLNPLCHSKPMESRDPQVSKKRKISVDTPNLVSVSNFASGSPITRTKIQPKKRSIKPTSPFQGILQKISMNIPYSQVNEFGDVDERVFPGGRHPESHHMLVDLQQSKTGTIHNEVCVNDLMTSSNSQTEMSTVCDEVHVPVKKKGKKALKVKKKSLKLVLDGSSALEANTNVTSCRSMIPLIRLPSVKCVVNSMLRTKSEVSLNRSQTDDKLVVMSNCEFVCNKQEKEKKKEKMKKKKKKKQQEDSLKTTDSTTKMPEKCKKKKRLRHDSFVDSMSGAVDVFSPSAQKKTNKKKNNEKTKKKKQDDSLKKITDDLLEKYNVQMNQITKRQRKSKRREKSQVLIVINS